MTTKTQSTKPEFGSRGQEFWNKTLTDYELSDTEQLIAVEVARALDEIEALKSIIEVEGISVKGSTGQTRVHPALNELRQHRLLLSKLVAQLQLPSEATGETLPTPRQVSARKAGQATARVRWGI